MNEWTDERVNGSYSRIVKIFKLITNCYGAVSPPREGHHGHISLAVVLLRMGASV